MSITDCDSVYGPGSGHLHDKVGDNPYPYAECTWYCWQFYKDTQQVTIPGALGNGTDWVASAHRLQWQVTMNPQENTIVCWSAVRYPAFGHVAICTGVDSGGTGFWVKEMNFTYYADENPQLAGKIDCRHVTSFDGIQGFILPQGVQAGASAGGTGGPADLLSALETPLTSIGKAINQAALLVEAEAMTARSKAISVAQMAGGGLVMAGGGTLAVLSTVGGGNPGTGAQRSVQLVTRGARRLRRSSPAPVAAPAGGRQLTAAEQSWMPAGFQTQFVKEHTVKAHVRRVPLRTPRT